MNICEQNKDIILSSLMDFRHLFDDLIRNPDWIINEINVSPKTEKFIYPCDVIDLRNILSREEIKHTNKVTLFGTDFAEKHLRLYPCFVVIDTKKNKKACQSFQSVRIYDSKNLNVKDCIVQVLINEPIDLSVKNRIIKIILEEKSDLPYYVSNSIPGISSPNPKFANRQRSKMFDVNIDALDIHVSVGAVDEVDAVKQVLVRKWKTNPENEGIPLPQQYKVEYWVGTPFWDNIVKKASTYNKKKMLE